MLVPTKDSVKVSNENTVHAQVISIVFFIFLIYPLYTQWDSLLLHR